MSLTDEVDEHGKPRSLRAVPDPPGAPSPPEQAQPDPASLNARFALASGRTSQRRIADYLRKQAPTIVIAGQLAMYDRKHGFYVMGDGPIRSKLTEIRGDYYTAREANEVLAILRDTSPPADERNVDMVNVLNGLLDLKTRTLYLHSPDYRSTVQLNVAYNPNADGRAFRRFLRQVLPDEDVQLLIGEWLGLLLVPELKYQRALLLTGAGANGKSVLIEVIWRLLGFFNCSYVPLHSLGEDRFIKSAMVGRLVNLAADIESYELRKTGDFKQIVAGDPVEVQAKYGHSTYTRLTTRLVFSANTKPATSDVSFGFFRRWHVVPFEETFVGANEDVDLAAKLARPDSLSGILNFALDGLERLTRQGGFTEAKAVTQASAEYRTEADSVASFVEEKVVIGPDYRIKGSDLYSRYRTYCEQSGRRWCGQKAMYERLRRLPELDGKLTEITPKGSLVFEGIAVDLEGAAR